MYILGVNGEKEMKLGNSGIVKLVIGVKLGSYYEWLVGSL